MSVSVELNQCRRQVKSVSYQMTVSVMSSASVVSDRCRCQMRWVSVSSESVSATSPVSVKSDHLSTVELALCQYSGQWSVLQWYIVQCGEWCSGQWVALESGTNGWGCRADHFDFQRTMAMCTRCFPSSHWHHFTGLISYVGNHHISQCKNVLNFELAAFLLHDIMHKH